MQFLYDVFLSHSSKDKDTVREIAQDLKSQGLKVWFDEWEILPGDSIFQKIEEGLEQSRILVLCMSAFAFGSDWATLEIQTFRFRDPMNRERRFIPLRLDETPPKGTLKQFQYIDWRKKGTGGAREKLYASCSAMAAPSNIRNVESQRWCQIVSVNCVHLGSGCCSFVCFQHAPPHGVGPAVLVT